MKLPTLVIAAIIIRSVSCQAGDYTKEEMARDKAEALRLCAGVSRCMKITEAGLGLVVVGCFKALKDPSEREFCTWGLRVADALVPPE